MLYCALTAALVILIAALATTSRQAAPPQIAELTPQAQHEIRRAPNQLTGRLGSANGAATGQRGATTTTSPAARGPSASTPAPSPIAVAAVHHCFGNPPMQISFDTQSPPCVAYWAGNNGGATTTGVTGTTVRVITYPYGNYFGDPNSKRVNNDLELFFNRYFEFYGRQLDFIYSPSANTGNGTCADYQAAANGVISANRPFASTDPQDPPCYDAAVARDHVVMSSLDPYFSSDQLASLAPYMWEYPMSFDQDLASGGRFVCTQLAGKDAVFSPDPVIARSPRKFGLLVAYQESGFPYNAAPIVQELHSCGITLAYSSEYEAPPEEGHANSAGPWAAQAITAMKNHGVTTIICACQESSAANGTISAAAQSQAYFPEWVQAWSDMDFNVYVHVWWAQADQRQAMMGLTFYPAQVPYPMTTLNQALESVDPGFSINYNSVFYYFYQDFYWEMLLLASGVQMAGPDLTPYTFQRGLQLAHFPNPFSLEQEGAVGFAGNSHSMTVDAAVEWWDNSAPSPYPDDGTGAWCYVDGGRRFTMATMGAEAMPLFQGPCASWPPGS